MRIFSKYCYRALLLFFVSSIFLSISSFAVSDSVSTRVMVIEGKVVCFDYPKDLASTILKEGAFVGTFRERIDISTGKAEIEGEIVQCYIPPEYRDTIGERLKPGVYVLLVKKARSKVVYIIVSVGIEVYPGYEHTSGRTETEKAKVGTIVEKVREAAKAGVGPDAVMAGIGPCTKVGEEPGEEPGSDSVINFSKPISGEPITDGDEQNKGGGPGAGDDGDGDGDGDNGGGPLLDEVVVVVVDGGGEPAKQYYWVNPTGIEYTIGDYTIAANGQNSGNFNGSNEQPWATITYALQRVQQDIAAGNLQSNNIQLVGNAANTATYGSGETFPLSMISSINLVGPGYSVCQIRGDSNNAVIQVNSVNSLTISGIRIRGGGGANGGGASISGSNNIRFDQCLIGSTTGTADANSVTGLGGGIYVTGSGTVGAPVAIHRSIIQYNRVTSTTAGGGLYVDSNSVVGVEGSTISNNTAGIGGGVYVSGSSFSIGAYYDANGNGQIDAGETFSLNSTVARNTGTNGGGGLYLTNASGSIRYTKIQGNNATVGVNGNGSGIYVDNPSGLQIDTCLIADNGELTGSIPHGPGIYCTSVGSDTLSIRNCTLANNKSTSGANEGQLFITSVSSPNITNCVFHLTLAGGMYNIYENEANCHPGTVANCFFYRDTIDADNYRDFTAGALTVAGLNGQAYANANVGGTTDRLDANYKIDSTTAPTPYNNALAAFANDYDVRGQSRPLNGADDIGCYEYNGTGIEDPPITGKVYDSVTGVTIQSPTIAIFEAGSTTVLSRTTSNPYTFNVYPGDYYIAVRKAGYGFPSQIVSSVVPGDHGGIFTAETDPLTIDIPMDPDGWLYIEKTANKKGAAAGEIVTYNIKIQNKHWYQAVNNVELVDEIINGFKYVSDSTYSSSSKMADPTITNRKAVFTVGTVPANSTTNISYQVRVGTGIPPGKYRTAAHTQKSTTEERNSNISSCSVEVIEDPLFTRGTIIGKVFWDFNGNGVQDKGEGGVPKVMIYTEYGVAVETDSDGKYHIADVPAGNHLLKVDTSVLPDWVTFTTDNPYYVKITEGLLAKVNFGVCLQESPPQISPPQSEDKSKSKRGGSPLRSEETKQGGSASLRKIAEKFFLVILAEGTVRNLDTSGNIDMIEKDDRYDDGVHVDGRLALYLKGKVLGKFLITASADTERRPGGRYDTRKLFTNLDPDKYYPVYGDASKVDYAGVDTQDVVYVLIEWDNSFAKWGSFNTEMPLYNRSLSGGIVNYKSVGKTKFGDIRTELKGFGAFSRQKPAHDEFVGTGGSLYYLRHSDVISGSEKIRIEVRDRVSKMTVNSISLYEEKDYEIDYDTGRILLRKPLNSIQQMYNNTIISNDILMGERVYLVVDYEYYGDGMSNEAWGANASQWIGNHIRVGGTYVQEQKEGDSATADRDYKLMGGDASVKLNKDTVVNAYYSRTEETQLGSSMSYDGGLTFSTQGENYSLGKSGSCVSVDGRTNLFGNTDIFLSYSRQDPYYSVTDSISSQGSHKYYATVVSKLTKHLNAGVSHITQKYFKGTVAEDVFGARGSHTTTGILDYRRGKWDLRAEYERQEVSDPLTSYTYFGTMPLLRNDFVAARAGYQLFSWLHAYVRGQGTVRGEANNQGTIGADINIGMYTTLNIAESIGNLGDSTLVGLTTRLTEGTDVYANLEVGNHMRLGKYTKTTYGQSSQISSDAKVYVEEDYSSYRENVVRGTVLGYHKKIKDTLGLGITYERSNVENNVQVIDRDSGAISVSYLNPDFLQKIGGQGLKISSKLELRNDRGSTEVRQWVTENDILWRVTEGITLTGRGNWGWTSDLDLKTDEAEFYELGTGFSLRPVTWDKLNILGKYSYLTNLPPGSQNDFPETTESRRNVYAVEGVFDVFRYLQLVGKFAYRDMKEKVGYRDWTDSDTYLYIARTNFHIMNTEPEKPFLLRGWDLGVEYRVLSNDQIEDSKEGFLVELDKDIGSYLRLGVGYNFTDYDDDLRNDDSWDSKGWFLRVSGKY